MGLLLHAITTSQEQWVGAIVRAGVYVDVRRGTSSADVG